MATKGIRYGNKLVSLGGKGIRPPYVIQDGLVMWIDPKDRKCYPKTGSDVVDLGPSQLSGTFTNDTFYADTVFRMDGVNDAVTIDGSDEAFFLSGNATVQFWIKPVHRPYSSRRAGMGRTNSYRQDINITLESHPLYRLSWYWGLTDFSAGGNYYSGAATLHCRYTTDEWNHITCVRDMSTSSTRIYKNGVLIDQSFATYTNNDGDAVFSPASPVDSNGDPTPILNIRLGQTHVGFNEGDFGSAYLYDRVLSADEIYENYLVEKYRYPHIPTEDLIVSIDANSPQYNYNASSNIGSHPGPTSDSVTFVYTNDAHVEKSTEISAIHHDGTNDWCYGFLPAANASGCLNNFTCLGWIRPDPSGINGQRVFGFNYVSQWQLELRGGSQESRRMGVNWKDEDSPTIPYKFNQAGPVVKYDTWQQIGIVCRDSTITYIYNGEEQNSFSITGDTAYSTNRFNVGNYNGGTDGAYLGQIANCQLYTRPLDAKEIKFIYDTYKSKYGF